MNGKYAKFLNEWVCKWYWKKWTLLEDSRKSIYYFGNNQVKEVSIKNKSN